MYVPSSKQDIVPREERAAASSSNSNSAPSTSTSHSKNGSTTAGTASGKRPSRTRKSSHKARQQEISTPAATAEDEGDQVGQVGEGSYEMSYSAPVQQEELSFEGLEEFEQAVQQEGGGGERSIEQHQPSTLGQPQYQQVYQNHYDQNQHPTPQQIAPYEQRGGGDEEGGEVERQSPGDGAFEGWDGLEMAPIDSVR